MIRTVFFNLKGTKIVIFQWNPFFFEHRPNGFTVSGDDAFLLVFRRYFQKDFYMTDIFKVWVVAIGTFHDNDVIIWYGNRSAQLPLGTTEWAESDTVGIGYTVQNL